MGGPPLAALVWTVSLGAAGGLGTARRAGVYRDDALLTLRGGLSFAGRLTVEAGLTTDVERIEVAARLGLRVRPVELGRLHPYLRVEGALVGAAWLGGDWELSAGAGGRVGLWRGFGAYAEVDAVGRLGTVRSLGDRFEAGLYCVLQ